MADDDIVGIRKGVDIARVGDRCVGRFHGSYRPGTFSSTPKGKKAEERSSNSCKAITHPGLTPLRQRL